MQHHLVRVPYLGRCASERQHHLVTARASVRLMPFGEYVLRIRNCALLQSVDTFVMVFRVWKQFAIVRWTPFGVGSCGLNRCALGRLMPFSVYLFLAF